MRALRSSAWMDPVHDPLTVVVLEGSTTDTLESVREGMKRVPDQQGKIFVGSDILEVGDADELRASQLAMEGMDYDREQNQAIMFFWVVTTLPAISEGGIIMSDKPAPLSTHEMAEVYEQVALSPFYKKQSFLAFNEQKQSIRFCDGKVTEDGSEV